MSVFRFNDGDALGTVKAVDTASVIVSVGNLELLRKLQVNRLVALQSSKPGQHLIGMVQRITRNVAHGIDGTEDSGGDDEFDETLGELNLVKIVLIGTLIDRVGSQSNVFRRTLETVPEIAANCFPVEGHHLTEFMKTISYTGRSTADRLSLGRYTLDDDAEAFLNGNKFFQRHALIVGSTGSGKSWTTARVLEQVARLANANAIVFDIHGEYKALRYPGIRHFRIAGPSELGTTSSGDVLYLPYWLLGYEDMIGLLLDRSDQNAPNQAMVFSRTVVEAKQAYLTKHGHTEILDNFTIDSPVPYAIHDVLSKLNHLNTEMVEGTRGQKQGDFYGKLSRFIARLENKVSDRRLGFMFGGPEETSDFSWLSNLAHSLMAGTKDQLDGHGGVKVIDFSEVPSDILPLIVSLVARLVFSVQQWTIREYRHPIALFCDEAHLYIPSAEQGASTDSAIRTFTRIAKEGRKYGVGLVVISQRPSEVDRTVLSQCNNVIAMRLTNAEDQSVVRRLLPDNLGGFSGALPILDTGEALVVGDASLLPSRIRVSEPDHKPDSATVNFWELWAQETTVTELEQAVLAWRKQSLV